MTAPEAGGNGGPGARRVVVTVGTDHHPFDRLIGWINDCLARYPERSTEFFVQSGTASVTPACPWSRFLRTDQLGALLDGAEVIVCHGGPASIASAWSRGQVPIVVPRLRRLGEHVDDHQLDFCVQVAEVGRIRLAQTAAAFAEYLDEAARDSRRFRCGALPGDVDTAVARFGALVEELVGRPARRPLLARRSRRSRPALEAGSGLPAAVVARRQDFPRQ
jgi:UDP-N-acetylglucosamine transferase subunit ALG13